VLEVKIWGDLRPADRPEGRSTEPESEGAGGVRKGAVSYVCCAAATAVAMAMALALVRLSAGRSPAGSPRPRARLRLWAGMGPPSARR